MVMYGSYYLRYTTDNEENELSVTAELRTHNIIKRFDPIWYAHIEVNGEKYTKTDTSGYVDAQCAAEFVGLKLKQEIKTKAHAEGKSFRTKKEELK